MPGNTVNFANFGATSLTIATNDGVFDFATTSQNGTIGDSPNITGGNARYDPATGLEAITLLQTDVFEFNTAAASGSLAGDFLWSNPGNWSLGQVPVNGQDVTVSSQSTSGVSGLVYDDLGTLSLSRLTELNADIIVTNNNLTVGALIGGGVSNIGVDPGGEKISATVASINIPITLTIDSISGSPFYLNAYGSESVVIDKSASNSGEIDEVKEGATLQLFGAVSDVAAIAFAGRGTLVLGNPGTAIPTMLQNLGRNDVIELPGNAVDFVNYGTSSITIATNLNTYTFGVEYAGSLSAYDARFDSATGLEAIFFRGVGPDSFEQVSAANFGLFSGYYLWSNFENWSDGLPLNGDNVTIASIGVDDLSSLTMPSVTMENGGQILLTGATLASARWLMREVVYRPSSLTASIRKAQTRLRLL